MTKKKCSLIIYLQKRTNILRGGCVMKLKITNKRNFKRTVLFITFGMLLILFFTLNNAYSNGEVKYKQEYRVQY